MRLCSILELLYRGVVGRVYFSKIRVPRNHVRITIYLTMGTTSCVFSSNSIINTRITLFLYGGEWNKLKSSRPVTVREP